VKMIPLPDTDVANFCALEPVRRRQELANFHQLRSINVSYGSFRQHSSDCLGLRVGMLELERPHFWKIARDIIRDCKPKTPLNIRSNLMVAAGIYQLAEALCISGRVAPELAPRLIGGHYVQCWNRQLLAIDGRPVIPFYDPRRSSSRLTPLGRRVALSIMHESIRAIYDDHADTRLAVVQFADSKRTTRKASIMYDDEVSLFSYDDLNRMIAGMYREWTEICEGREEEAHRRADEEDDAASAPPLVKIWRKGA
jgi:hypothetical protein